MDPFRTTVNFADSFEFGATSPSPSLGGADISMQRRSFGGTKRLDPQPLPQQSSRSQGFPNENSGAMRNLPPTFSVLDDKRANRRTTASAHSNATVNMASPSTSTSFSTSHVHFGPLDSSPAQHLIGYASSSNPNLSHTSHIQSGFIGSGTRNVHEMLEQPTRTRDNRDRWPVRQGQGQGGSPAPAAAPQNTSSYSIILQDDIPQSRVMKTAAVDVSTTDSFMSPPSGFPTLTSPSSSALSSLQLEALWNTWVVVFGYDPHLEQHSLENMLHRFSQYGEIENHSTGRGNWIFIKYVSPNQAERACSQNGSFLNSGTMIAVSRMNATVASSMGVGLREGGQLLVPLEADFSSGGGDSRRKGDRPLLLTDYSSSSSSSGVTSRLGRGAKQLDGVPFQRQAARTPMSSSSAKKERPPSSSSSSAEETEDLSDIYVKPPRRPSICKQLMEYLFSFKY